VATTPPTFRVLARLGLQRPDLVMERTPSQHGGVLPPRVAHGGGDDVLRHRVEVVGDAGGVVGLFGPVAAQLLERHPPEHDGVGRFALLAERGHEVGLVDFRIVGDAEPTRRRVDDAIEGDVLGDDQISHRWTEPPRVQIRGRFRGSVGLWLRPPS
jgi:hypothetical protein